MATAPETPLDWSMQDAYELINDPAYAAWRKKFPQLKATADYDLYLAFKNGAEPDERGHLTDIGKRPNHITYSTDSIYAKNGPQAGEWRDNNGIWEFHAAPINIQNAGSREKLIEYFQKYEPEAKLFLP